MDTKTLITEDKSTWPPTDKRVLCIWEDACTVEKRITIPNHSRVHNKLIQAIEDDEGNVAPLDQFYNRIKWMPLPKWED